MFKALTPIVAILLALGLIITHVQPSFVSIKALQDETADYVDALAKANEFKALIDEKVALRNTFDPFDLERLAIMLPEEQNELALILSLDALAQDEGMSLSGIQIGQSVTPEAAEAEGEIPEEEVVAEPAALLLLEHVDISFSLEGTYDEFRSFVSNLEESLVMFEIMSAKLGASEGDSATYELTVRAFNLRSPQ